MLWDGKIVADNRAVTAAESNSDIGCYSYLSLDGELLKAATAVLDAKSSVTEFAKEGHEKAFSVPIIYPTAAQEIENPQIEELYFTLGEQSFYTETPEWLSNGDYSELLDKYAAVSYVSVHTYHENGEARLSFYANLPSEDETDEIEKDIPISDELLCSVLDIINSCGLWSNNPTTDNDTSMKSYDQGQLSVTFASGEQLLLDSSHGLPFSEKAAVSLLALFVAEANA